MQTGCAQFTHVDVVPYLQGGFQRSHLDNRRRADPHAFDAGGGAIGLFEGKRGVVAKPATERRGDVIDKIGADIDEGWRARAAVQILVGASHRKFAVRPGKIDRNGPRTVGQVPEHHGPRRVRRFRDPLHVMHPTCAVVDLRDHGDGNVIAHRAFHVFRGNHAQRIVLSQKLDQAFCHVEVRGKVAAV